MHMECEQPWQGRVSPLPNSSIKTRLRSVAFLKMVIICYTGDAQG
jgi:hypothetical protein